jgi:hypothetical protein
MNAWESGDRAGAARVATSGAVATLFATAYAGQPLNSRGCSVAFPPLVCSYGPYAGGSGDLYEVYVSQAPSAWYVSSVDIES